jgi:hypothetical protein
VPATAVALIALAALVLAVPAQASYDPIGSGSATLSLDKSFTSTLKTNGIVLSGRKSAKVKGSKVLLKAAGGKADPTIAKAEIDLGGELFFKKGSRNLNLKAISLKTKPTPIFAKVSGGQLKVAKAAKVTLVRSGFGNELIATSLKLTAKTATRLNKKLGVDAFAQGQKLGTLKSNVQPSTVAIKYAGLLTMTVDPAIAAKLNADSVSLNSIFPAERQGAVFTMPIDLGGALAPDGKSGTLRTAGAMELLRQGQGQLFWKELWFDFAASNVSSEEDLEPAPPFPGKKGRVPTLDFSVPAGSFTTDPAARTISVSAGAVTLPADTAALFNQGFSDQGKEDFHAGEVVGSFSFTAQSQ